MLGRHILPGLEGFMADENQTLTNNPPRVHERRVRRRPEPPEYYDPGGKNAAHGAGRETST
jgi:hypothetical protein